MSTAHWFSSLARSNPELHRLVYDFIHYPHRWARTEWLDGCVASSPTIALLEQSPRGRTRLGRHYCAALGLKDNFWEFEARQRRLALLPHSALAQLGLFVGAALHWMSLARCVTQAEHRATIEQIGHDAYSYGLRRGRTLLGASGLGTPNLPSTEGHANLAVAGWKILAACLQQEPPAVFRRFRLKSPRDIELHDSGELALSPATAWAIVQPVITDILPRSEQQCFA